MMISTRTTILLVLLAVSPLAERLKAASLVQTTVNVTATVALDKTDGDTDQMPDQWEHFFFPGDLDALTALGDFDGDGLSDRHEYLAGTDPTDPTSSLFITPPHFAPDGTLLIEWSSSPWIDPAPRRYTLWCADTIDAILTNPIPVAIDLLSDGTMTTNVISPGPLQPRRYYRVELSSP